MPPRRREVAGLAGLGRALARFLPLRPLLEARVVLGVVALVYAAFCLMHAADRVADPDVLWVAAAGRDILSTGHAPTANGYAFTAPMHPWVMHEWLFGVVYAGLAKVFGVRAFGLMITAVDGLQMTLLAVALGTQTKRLSAWALAMVLVVVGLNASLFQTRPPFVALAFVTLMVAIVFRPGWSYGRALAAAGIELVWANAHGSFPLGVLLVFASAFSEARARGTRERSHRLASAAACAAVTVLNPYGLRLHALVLHYAAGDSDISRWIHGSILEFRPLWEAVPVYATWAQVAGLLVILLLAASALRRRRFMVRALFVLAWVVLAIAQARNVSLAVLLGGLLLAGEIDALTTERGLPAGEPLPPARRMLAVMIPMVVLGVAFAAWTTRARPDDAWLADDLGGASLARLVRALPDGARVFTLFQPSGAVLWEGAGRGVLVYYDPRNDCYPVDVAKDASRLEFQRLAPDVAAALLEQRGTEYVLAPGAHPLTRALLESGRFREAGSDGDWTTLRAAHTEGPR